MHAQPGGHASNAMAVRGQTASKRDFSGAAQPVQSGRSRSRAQHGGTSPKAVAPIFIYWSDQAPGPDQLPRDNPPAADPRD
jgi:hypothetical protein